jgi:ketosteroid isomerase-like protein
VTASTNLELVRSIFADWEHGDYSSLAWAHPEIEFVIVGGVAPGSFRGVPSMVERWQDGLGAWSEHRVAADEYRELDEEQVLVLSSRSGRGKTSGLELSKVQTRGAHLFRVRGAKVTTLVTYFDRDDAFTDLGLAAESG